MGYRKSQDSYEYNSSTFGSARKIINYFDRFHLLSRKHVNYLKWRKVYCKIADLNTSSSQNGLLKLKKSSQSLISYTLKNVREYSTNCKTFKLNSWWITGFSDGDSSKAPPTLQPQAPAGFMINFKKRINLTWQIMPVFQIGLNIKDEEIIKKIKHYFNDAGNVSYDVENNKVYHPEGGK